MSLAFFIDWRVVDLFCTISLSDERESRTSPQSTAMYFLNYQSHENLPGGRQQVQRGTLFLTAILFQSEESIEKHRVFDPIHFFWLVDYGWGETQHGKHDKLVRCKIKIK